MSALPIADRPDRLTPAWLTSALGDAVDGATVIDVVATPVGTGQMCESLRLALTYDRPGAGPASVVAKIPSADPSSRAAGQRLGIYETEVRFYRELAPHLAVRTPEVLHASLDPATAAFVLLMEDLAPARQGDQLAGCTVEQAVLVVDEAVGLHASLWGDPTLADLGWLGRPAADRPAIAAALPRAWAGFTDRHGSTVDPVVIDVGAALVSAVEAYAGRDRGPATLVHGDLRLDNVLFGGAEGGRPVVVDWQTCAAGSGPADLAYFLGSGLLPGPRREAERDLVRRYHDRLVAAGVTDLGWDRCWDAYRVGALGGLVMAVTAAMLVARTERGDAMFQAMAERHARQVLDLEALDLL